MFENRLGPDGALLKPLAQKLLPVSDGLLCTIHLI